MDKTIFGKVDEYINSMFASQDDVLAQTERSIIESGLPQISVSPNQGKFLHLMAKLCGAKKILEIGTLGGYSTIWMARALPGNGKLITLEIDPRHAAIARKNFSRAGLDTIIDLRLGKAIDILPRLVEEGAGPFDLIFIDADKPPYTEYFKWSQRLSRSGTLIIADNVIRDGRVLDPNNNDEMVQGVKRFNKALSETKGVTATIFQTVGSKEHDGIALAVVD